MLSRFRSSLIIFIISEIGHARSQKSKFEYLIIETEFRGNPNLDRYLACTAHPKKFLPDDYEDIWSKSGDGSVWPTHQDLQSQALNYFGKLGWEIIASHKVGDSVHLMKFWFKRKK